jgi:alpha/beta superfamily hydrolase
MAAARFNFRGVGRSNGLHDDGVGEVEDVIAMVDWMRAMLPGADCVLAGFSFGGYVSIKAAERVQPQRLVSISPPFGRYMKADRHPAQPQCPWLVVHSRDDEVVSYAETAAALQTYERPPQLVTFEGAGHYYHGRLTDLSDVVLPFLQQGPG